LKIAQSCFGDLDDEERWELVFLEMKLCIPIGCKGSSRGHRRSIKSNHIGNYGTHAHVEQPQGILKKNAVYTQWIYNQMSLGNPCQLWMQSNNIASYK
jgi:hypothetical protein